MDMTALDRHELIVIQFSGGKDSLAVLELCKPWWHKVTVLFANSGNEFPETLEVIESIKRLPIKLVEVKPDLDQPESVETYGYPSDVIPLRNTHEYEWLSGRSKTGVAVQHPMSCCARILYEPMHKKVIELGATLVIRGQRLDEDMTSPVMSGDVIDGIEYFFPVEDWSEADVFAYLNEQGVTIPAHYGCVKHSLDCMTCTAFLDRSKDKIAYMKQFHQEAYAVVSKRLKDIKASIDNEYAHLIDAVNI